MEIINESYQLLPVDRLVPHPDNPNRGDLDVISESVDVNGFYGAATVRAHPDQPGDWQILAGEHRWRTARAKGSPVVPCIVINASDDVTAARVMLVDNESAKRSTYDADALTRVLRGLGSVEGTGFSLAGLADFEQERQDNEPPDENETEFVREYGVIVYVGDEDEQRTVYEKLRAEGYRCRVASI